MLLVTHTRTEALILAAVGAILDRFSSAGAGADSARTQHRRVLQLRTWRQRRTWPRLSPQRWTPLLPARPPPNPRRRCQPDRPRNPPGRLGRGDARLRGRPLHLAGQGAVPQYRRRRRYHHRRRRRPHRSRSRPSGPPPPGVDHIPDDGHLVAACIGNLNTAAAHQAPATVAVDPWQRVQPVAHAAAADCGPPLFGCTRGAPAADWAAVVAAVTHTSACGWQCTTAARRKGGGGGGGVASGTTTGGGRSGGQA